MVAPYPEGDPRRARKLLNALERMAPALVPEWNGFAERGSFGRALFELAARMGEEVTRRLDQTARRDAIAFFDTLDIPPAAPRAAEAPLIFTLTEKRELPVHATARLQVAAQAEADGTEVIFETRDDMTFTPARLAQLIAVDPASDRIEQAPPGVLSVEPPVGPLPIYRLASFAATESAKLQITPTIGLGSGDLVRVGGAAYRVDKLDGDILTLHEDDPLEAPAAAGSTLKKIASLEAFDLRNLQRHAAYVGHAEQLNLEQPALITLEISPASAARRLKQLDVTFDLWGTLDGAEEPDWQELGLAGSSGGAVNLFKSWLGTVDEREVHGKKNRWLRIRLNEPIRSRAGIGTRIGTLELKVESMPPTKPAPDAPAAEGSQTIKQAYHNGTPLPLTSSFFPFGPEPLRFDSFSLAAPEALTKKDATVTLDITLVDSSPDALALVVGSSDPRRAYAVAVNGRLQAIAFNSDGTLQRWQELNSPAEVSDGAVADGARDRKAGRLDGAGLLEAVELPPVGQNLRDLVLAQDRNGDIWIQIVERRQSTGAFEGGVWQAMPKLADPPPTILGAIVLPPPGAPPRIGAYLLAVTESGLHRLTVPATGEVKNATWTELTDVPTQPNYAGAVRLVGEQGEDWPRPSSSTTLDLVLLDSDGEILRGDVNPTGSAVNWEVLPTGTTTGGTPRTASLKVRPAAARLGTDEFVVVVAEEPSLVPFAVRKLGGNQPAYLAAPATPNFTVSVGTSLLCCPAYTDLADGFPLVASFGKNVGGDPVIALWTREDRLTLSPLQTESAPGKFPRGFWLPGGSPNSDPPTLVVNGQRETLLRGNFAARKLSIELFDRVNFDDAVTPGPAYVELKSGTAASHVVAVPSNPVLIKGGYRLFAIERGEQLALGDAYRFLEDLDLSTVVWNGTAPTIGELELDAGDLNTAQGDLLLIDSKIYTIDTIDTSASPYKATLDPDLPNPGTLSYRRVGEIVSGTVADVDIATLLRVDDVTEKPSGEELVFVPPANPPRQPIATIGDVATGTTTAWILLGAAWIPPVPTGAVAASADLISTDLLADWTSDALEHGYQNPELSWEYFDGDGWRRLDRAFQDTTDHLALSGEIRFTVPDDLAETDVAGQMNYWIRARLVGGDYGRARYISKSVTDPANVTTQTIIVDTSHLRPPEILSIEAAFTLEKAIAPERVLTDNNLAVLDQTPSAAVAGARFDLFEGLLAIEATGGEEQPLAARALYLGFSKRFDVNPLSLYADAEEQPRGGRLRADILLQRGWVTVAAKDETAALQRRGFVSVFVNEPPVRAALFGHELYWLRLSLAPLVAGLDVDWAPKLNGLYVNAAIADQAKSIEQEILGSSLGEPDQTFTLAENPVLAESLELRVRERLSDEEREAIETAPRAEPALETVRRDKPAIESKVPDIPGDWVLWERVDSFVGRDGDARVFRLDPASGTVSFGNGRQGKIPPAGRDRLRAFFYQSSGGTRGNVPAYAIKDLKSAPEAVETVANPVDAAGGVDTPSIDDLIATAPARLRHSDRALAPADLEALAVAWSPEIVRARTRGPDGPDEKIKLAIAMRTGSRCPVPSLAQREALARYLLERAWGGLEADAIEVVPPDYVRVSVDVEVLASTADRVAQVKDEAFRRLAMLLHPIEGGPDGRGWPFGRRLWPSDVHRTLNDIEGVDRIAKVELRGRAESGEVADLDNLDCFALVCAEERDIRVRVLPGEGP